MNNDFLINHCYFRNPKALSYKPEAHELWEFLFVIKGSIVCMTEGESYSIGDNTLLFFKPTQVHGIHISKDYPFEYVSLMCGEWTLPDELLEQISDQVSVLQLKDIEQFYRTLMEYKGWVDDNNSVVNPQIRTLLVTGLLRLILGGDDKVVAVEPFRKDPVVCAAASYIESNIRSIRGLGDICAAVGVDKACLYNLFVKNMMISPTKYIRLKRIAAARLMLYNKTEW